MKVTILGGEARGRPLVTVPGHSTRVATASLRTSLFDILKTRLQDARVLDLFGGIGSFGLEALSRGAAHATFVEKDSRCLKVIRRNLETLGYEGCSTVIRGDALRYPKGLESAPEYSIAFVDPPYAMFDERRSRTRIDDLVGRLRGPAELVILKHSKGKGTDGAFDCRRYGDTELSFYRPTDV
jgi:16S rRNA (guanine966-N2)-methyltransferase